MQSMPETDPPDTPDDDTVEAYRQHLAYLINTPPARMSSRHLGRHINRCRELAAQRYPKGAAAAKSGDFGWILVVLGIAFLVYLVLKA